MDLTQEQLNILAQPIRNKKIRVELLNDELVPINSIEGFVIDGKINANSENDTRRSGNISLSVPIAVDSTTFLDNSAEDILIYSDGGYWIDKLLKIYIGIEDLSSKTNNTVWFKMGVFLMNNPVRNFSANEYTISFNLADQNIKLNGQRQGQLTGLGTIIPAGEYVKTDSLVFKKSFPDKGTAIFNNNRGGAYKSILLPNSRYMVYLLYDYSVKAFRLNEENYPEGAPYTSSVFHSLPDEEVYDINVRPDGKQILLTTRTAIYIYTPAKPITYNSTFYNTGQIPLNNTLGSAVPCCFSSDSTLFALSRSDSTTPLELYSTISDLTYEFIGYVETNGDEYGVKKCLFSPDNKHIICSQSGISIRNKQLRAFSIETMKEDNTVFDNTFYSKYGNIGIKDFAFNLNGNKFTVFVNKYPYLISFNSSTKPYSNLSYVKDFPGDKYNFCNYDNNDRLIVASKNLNKENPILIYNSNYTPYKMMPNEMRSFTTADNEKKDGFKLDGFEVKNDIVYMYGIGYDKETIETGSTIFASIYDIKRNEEIFVYNKTLDTLKSVIEELTYIKRYIIYNIPEQYKYLPYDVKVGVSSTASNVLKNFKNILSSWQFYFDLDGVYRIEPVPSGKNNFTFPLDYGSYLRNQISYNYENVKNQIVVYGKPNNANYYTENIQSKIAHIIPNTTQYSSDWLASKYNIEFLETNRDDGINCNSITYARKGRTYGSPENRFVAVEANSKNIIYSEDNGATWKKKEVLPVTQNWNKIIDNGHIRGNYADLFAFSGKIGNSSTTAHYAAYSTNVGDTWTEIELPFPASVSDAAFLGSDQIVAVIHGNDEYSALVCRNSQSDPNTWVPIKVTDYEGNKLTFEHITSMFDWRAGSNNACAIAINSDGYFLRCEGSFPDSGHLITETGIRYQNSVAIGEVSNNNGEYSIVAVTVGDNGVGAYSTNKGRTWKQITLPYDNYTIVKYVGQYQVEAEYPDYEYNNVDGYFVAIGYKYIITSKNGIDWDIIPKQSGYYNDLAFNFDKNLVAFEYGYSGTILGEKKYSIIEPEEETYYKVPVFYPMKNPTTKYFTWDGSQYTEVETPEALVEYSDNALNLYYESAIDLTNLSIKATLFGFMSNEEYNTNKIEKLNIYSEGILVLTGVLTDFENVKGYIAQNAIQPNTIYVIRILDAEITEENLVNTNSPITFELYSRQQPSACLVDDNKESPFYINRGLQEPNFYAGMAEIDSVYPNEYKIGESYRLVLNNEPYPVMSSVADGTLITFMANSKNIYADGSNHTSITVVNISGQILLSNVPLVQNKLEETIQGEIRRPVEEGKLNNDYLIHLIKYDASKNQFIYLGKNPKSLLLVLSGGEYDNIYADQLAYERCLWELYSHSNMQNTISVEVVPNYALDVNMRIPYNEKMQYPIATSETRQFEDSYYLTKQITYPLGISSAGSQITALKIYDSGNLLPE